MDFRILDASAFYAGVPFQTSKTHFTTILVYEEIKHIKKNQDVLSTLIETNRLKIIEPEESDIKQATDAAKKSGDLPQLSPEDISIIALGIKIKGEIISDDFAVSNVAKNIGLKISPIMTKGIRDVGNWIHYCPGCKKTQKKGKECSNCATPLKRKLLKR